MANAGIELLQINKKRALVIGNSNYSGRPLINARKDATDMANILQYLDFDVTLATDCTRDTMIYLIDAFTDKFENRDLVLFYFAGHGFQHSDINYLVPTDTIDKLRRPASIRSNAINVQITLEDMQWRALYATIFILDCCREYLLTDLNRFRGVGITKAGLAEMVAPGGTLIQFACAANREASDGTLLDENGLFTKHLIRHIGKPNIDLQILLRYVVNDVRTASADQQYPFQHSNLTVPILCLNEGTHAWPPPPELLPVEIFDPSKIPTTYSLGRWSLIILTILILLSAIFHSVKGSSDIIDVFYTPLQTSLVDIVTKLKHSYLNIASVELYSMPLSTILLRFVRYNWIVLYIIMNELLMKRGWCLKYLKHYRIIKKKVRSWCANDYSKSVFVIVLVLIGPYLIEAVALYVGAVATYCMNFIRYFWLITLVVFAELMSNYHPSHTYIQQYQNIKQLTESWCTNYKIRREIVFILIVIGPFLLDQAVLYCIQVPETPISLPWLSFVFIVRYNWLILLVMLDAILVGRKFLSQYSDIYIKLKNTIDSFLRNNLPSAYVTITRYLTSWHEMNRSDRRITLVSILITPLAIELIVLYTIPVTYATLIALWKTILAFMRYGWLAILVILSENFRTNDVFPMYMKKYNLIAEKVQRWTEGNSFYGKLCWLAIGILPWILEIFCKFSIPIIASIVYILWRVFVFIIRYCWLGFIVVIAKTDSTDENSADTPENNQTTSQTAQRRTEETTLHYTITITIAFITPMVLGWFKIGSMSIQERFESLLLAIILFIIRYFWATCIVFIICVLSDLNSLPTFIEEYKSKLSGEEASENNKGRNLTIFWIIVLIAPFALQAIIIWHSSIVQLYTFLLQASLLILIRYFWPLLFMFISEIVHESKLFPTYTLKYRRLERRIDRWSRRNRWNDALLLVLLFFGPFLLELFVLYGIKMIATGVVWLVRNMFFYFVSIAGFYYLSRFVHV